MIIAIDPKLIDSNPYQPRADMNGEPLQRLAEDIKEHGLLQKPAARPMPDGRYQLAFGHRRLAAWQIAFPGEPIPVDVDAMDDKQMFTAAIVENEQREALSAIEKARAMQAYIDAFKVTQLEAGKLFNLTSQGAVSNLLRLLKLPDPIQQLVIDGELPERFARAVLPLSIVRPGDAGKIAKTIANAPEERREDAFKSSMWTVMRGEDVKSLHSAPWGDLGWPGKPIASGNEAIPELVACKGCPFNIRNDDRDNCLRPACFELKTVAWSKHEAEHIAKKLGIPPLAENEKPKIIYAGDYSRAEAHARKALANLKSSLGVAALLRIVPYTEERGYNGEWNRRQVLGSGYVALATTDERQLEKVLVAIKEPKKPAGNVDANAWRAKEAARAKQRNNQAKENRRLIDAALPYWLPRFPMDESLLNLMWSYEFVQRSDWDKMKAADKPRALLRGMMISKFGGQSYSPAKPADVVKKLERISTEMKVRLPHGWSAEAKPTTTPQPRKQTRGGQPAGRANTKKATPKKKK